jgi:NADH-quinone oxidoreductase subunit H
LSARLQWRIGPPWYQPFADFLKLLGKENLAPQGARSLGFLVAPFVGLAGVTLASTVLWMSNISPGTTFVGDLIVVIYFLTLPALAVVLGGSSSRNPFGATGASRELKLVLAYELPLLIALMTPVVKSGGIISIGGLLDYQARNGWMLGNASCAIAFAVALICAQAKLGLPPFDLSEAETELIAGPFVEYSGTALALFKLTRAMMLVVVPVLLITLFISGAWSYWTPLAYVLILLFFVLLKNTNPRVRIDQALRFFWVPVLLVSVVGIVLAAVGV